MSLAAPSAAVSLARCKYSTDVCVSLRRPLMGARSESGSAASVPGATINASTPKKQQSKIFIFRVGDIAPRRATKQIDAGS
mmetsp:Transcript_9717/g.39788  ORF Transcript_9717/g.39788 Transcript_9717/m.39788 type:complete len:81 (+) Transcript_9717:272-514(+)